jgi:hypothetical protein
MKYLVFLLVISLIGCKTNKVSTTQQTIETTENKLHGFDDPYYTQYILIPSFKMTDTAKVPPFVDLYIVEYDMWLSPVDSCEFPGYNLIILN